MSIRDRLRDDTLAVHRALEKQLDLLDADLSLARYESVIRAFYGFYRPLEASIRPLLPAAPPLGFSPPNRAAFLELDLRYLGYGPDEIAQLPRCENVPAMLRTEHLAGAMYVVEGASLGARVISRSLRKSLDLHGGAGAVFFADGDHDTSFRWRSTLTWLNHVAQLKATQVNEIVASARGVFTSLSHWTEQVVLRSD